MKSIQIKYNDDKNIVCAKKIWINVGDMHQLYKKENFYKAKQSKSIETMNCEVSKAMG